MSESYGDLVAAALHAEADAGRERLRALGITCPSCGKNAADLTHGGHRLDMTLAGEPGAQSIIEARCREGSPKRLDGFGEARDAVTVSVLDDLARSASEAVEAAVGTGPANFTGLLDVLNG